MLSLTFYPTLHIQYITCVSRYAHQYTCLLQSTNQEATTPCKYRFRTSVVYIKHHNGGTVMILTMTMAWLSDFYAKWYLANGVENKPIQWATDLWVEMKIREARGEWRNWWQSSWQLIPSKHRLDSTVYLCITADHLHSFHFQFVFHIVPKQLFKEILDINVYVYP